jgi:hypothetical protein
LPALQAADSCIGKVRVKTLTKTEQKSGKVKVFLVSGIDILHGR